MLVWWTVCWYNVVLVHKSCRVHLSNLSDFVNTSCMTNLTFLTEAEDSPDCEWSRALLFSFVFESSVCSSPNSPPRDLHGKLLTLLADCPLQWQTCSTTSSALVECATEAVFCLVARRVAPVAGLAGTEFAGKHLWQELYAEPAPFRLTLASCLVRTTLFYYWISL